MSETTGQLKVKYDTQKVSEKFQKRDFVLAIDLSTPYPQYITFQLTQDKCNILDSVNEGDEIKVQFNLRGREWSGPQGIKYFNTLEAWRVEKISEAASNNTTEQNINHAQNESVVNNSNLGDNDDLPF